MDLDAPRPGTSSQSRVLSTDDPDAGDDDAGGDAISNESRLGASTNSKQKATKAGTASKGKGSKVKYTLLQRQFLTIKEKLKDAVLFMESGHKYRFFGDDAEVHLACSLS